MIIYALFLGILPAFLILGTGDRIRTATSEDKGVARWLRFLLGIFAILLTILVFTIPGENRVAPFLGIALLPVTGAVFLKDLNSDGNLDARIAGVKKADIWWNDGHGTFTRSDQHFRYSNRHGLAVEDFNGDGYVDIFAGSYTEDYII
ncbi:MAG: FG-GAP-like repeat-containing protein [Anaerolineales bacterium]